jgi:multiple sugar transport system ATP-binding protein
MNFVNGKLEKQNGAYFFNEGSFSVELPEKMSSGIEGREGQEVVFGIRPEDVRDRDHFPEVKPTRCVTAKVEVIEPVGSESIWYVATPASSFIAKVDPHARAEVNKDKDLVFFVEKAHVFDAETQESIV